jgi:hypothetical protein
LSFEITPEMVAEYDARRKVDATAPVKGRCLDSECTGVHDNNRYGELCPRSLRKKRKRDLDYHHSLKGHQKRWRAYLASLQASIERKDMQLAATFEHLAGILGTSAEEVEAIFECGTSHKLDRRPVLRVTATGRYGLYLIVGKENFPNPGEGLTQSLRR